MAGAVLRSGRLCENFHPHRQDRARTSTIPACHTTKPQITDLPNDFDEPLAGDPCAHRARSGSRRHWTKGTAGRACQATGPTSAVAARDLVEAAYHTSIACRAAGAGVAGSATSNTLR